MHMMYYYPGMGWWMVLSSLIWLGLLGIAVWAFLRWVTHQTQPGGRNQTDGPPTGSSALEILRQRFARGEIDSETFERMRHQLDASRAAEVREPASPSARL